MAVKNPMPDMSRNTALAGKTVYSGGMNVTYDDRGYAVRATNPNHSNYKGTTMSVAAQPKADALAGKEWTPPDTSGLINWGDGTGMGGGSSGGTRAARSTGGTGSAYDASYGAGYLSAYYDAQKAANDAAVQRAIGQLTAQKTALNESYDDYARQAYRDKMGAERDIDQYLGARGITGGAAESTILGLNTSYADELRKIEQSRRETLSALDQAISEARLTGDFNNAKAAADAAKEQASLYAQELKERKATEAAQEQYARAEAQNQQSWARSLAGQMLAAGRMPDNDTLAAAGLTRAQAELLLTTPGVSASDRSWARQIATQLLSQGIMPDDGTLSAAGITSAQAQLLLTPTAGSDTYTPTFTVAQVQSEINRALKYGTSLPESVLRDYEYYYKVPYSAPGAQTYSASSGRSSSSSKSSSGTGYSNGNGSGGGSAGGSAGNYQSVYSDLQQLRNGGADNTTIINVLSNALQRGWIGNDEAIALRNIFVKTTR